MLKLNIKKVAQYYHTIKYLKWTQIYGQIHHRFKKPKVNTALPPKRRQQVTSWTASIVKPSQSFSTQTLTFLQQSKNISSNTIWNSTETEKLWLYNLHYFDFLHSCTARENYNWCENFIHRWIRENLPAEGCGWEPYPISLRLVNWIKWQMTTQQIDSEILHSLAIQTRYLMQRIETHLLGNHILANAKALLFSGLFFSGKEANRWFKTGFKIYQQQLVEQVLSDGGHFELSPMYHAIILEDLLDMVNLFHVYDRVVPPFWITCIKKMISWFKIMCHPDGEMAFFNDTALGVAACLSELEKYCQRLSLSLPDSSHPQELVYLPASGYCRLQNNNMVLLTDVAAIGASYQPGHAHADTLSFELSLGNQRLLVNSGTSTYAVNHERINQRRSKAHNTLVIDEKDSSEVWKSFRVARRAKVYDIITEMMAEKLCLTASHDGYASVKAYHTRRWILKKNSLTIEDSVVGSGIHQLDLFFHLHPVIQVQQKHDHGVTLYNASGMLLASLETNFPLTVEECTYHPEFNMAIANKKIQVKRIFQNLPVQINTTITLT